MSDPYAPIRIAFERSHAEVKKLRERLADAERKHVDLATTWRVVSDLCPAATDQPAGSEWKIDPSALIVSTGAEPRTVAGFERRKAAVRNALGVGQENSIAPSAIYQRLLENGVTDINVENVRTIVWRLSKQEPHSVASADGRYWRVQAQNSAPNENAPPSEFDELLGGAETGLEGL